MILTGGCLERTMCIPTPTGRDGGQQSDFSVNVPETIDVDGRWSV